MSCGSAGLPTSFDRFREVWEWDFEYRLDDNHLPVPVALFAKEHRTGTEIAMRREQLLSPTRLPFDDGADVVATSYSAVAELGCCLQRRWPFPRNVLCTYFETSAQINGLDIVGLGLKRPSLLEACELFDIPHMEKEHKAHVRDIILNNTDYTEEQWQEIADYNRDDGLHDIPLFAALAPNIDVPAERCFAAATPSPLLKLKPAGYRSTLITSTTWRRTGTRCACSTSGVTTNLACTTTTDRFVKIASKP